MTRGIPAASLLAAGLSSHGPSCLCRYCRPPEEPQPVPVPVPVAAAPIAATDTTVYRSLPGAPAGHRRIAVEGTWLVCQCNVVCEGRAELVEHHDRERKAVSL